MCGDLAEVLAVEGDLDAMFARPARGAVDLAQPQHHLAAQPREIRRPACMRSSTDTSPGAISSTPSGGSASSRRASPMAARLASSDRLSANRTSSGAVAERHQGWSS